MLVQHHTKYKEIHGEDKIVMMPMSEHTQLHKRLRREGKCNVPTEELAKISRAAYKRTRKGNQADKQATRRYVAKNIQRFYFSETLGPNVRLHEQIEYNHKIGSFCYSSYFYGQNGHMLPVVEMGCDNVE